VAFPPIFVAEQETAFNAITPKNVGASITALINDILVEVAGMEAAADNTNNTAADLGTPTGGTSVVRTSRATQDSGVNTSAEARAWTAPITSGQTFTPSFSRTGAINNLYIGTALLFRSSDGVGAATSTNNGTGTGAPSVGITTQQDNSAIVAVIGDWTAATTTRTWLTVNGITPTVANGFERSYFSDGAHMGYYVAYWPDAGAAGLKTVGLSAPSTMRYVICAVEIKGAQGPRKLIMQQQAIRRAAYW
jgi:hypothetical protein